MIKRTFLKWHRWIALAFAPLLLLQATTGAVLALKDIVAPIVPSAPVFQPLAQRHDGSPASISTLKAKLERYFPRYSVTRLFLPSTSQSAAFAQLDNPDGEHRYAVVDPNDGRIMKSGSIWRFPFEAALQLHFQLMKPSVGIAIVIANGAALAIVALSGLVFWWPGRKNMVKALTIRRSANANLMLRQYHRSTGAVIAVIVLFSAVTGVLLDIPNLPPVRAAPPSRQAMHPTALAIDRAVALASAQFPASALRDIRFGTDGTLAINFFAPERNPRAVHVVLVDAASHQLLKAVPAQANTASWMTILPLHTGESFGLPGQLLLLIGVFALIFLTISGPLTWWRSRASKRSRK